MKIGAISRFVLAHKLVVVVFWAVVTVVAIATVSSSVGALSKDFSVPGREGAETNQAILATYGNGASNPPLVPVVTLPAGTTVDSPEVVDERTALFASIQQAAPSARRLLRLDRRPRLRLG
jgi:RND superfamily putative drug exporter